MRCESCNGTGLLRKTGFSDKTERIVMCQPCRGAGSFRPTARGYVPDLKIIRLGKCERPAHPSLMVYGRSSSLS